ncbi:MAG: choice-of-anchor B family protein [Bacteroidota bacterium]
MRRFFNLIVFFFVLLPLGNAQSPWNLVEIGHLANDSTASGLPIRSNDIWAYVDSAGTEYALLGKQDGLSIISLLDPTQPVELHYLPGNNSIWRDIKTAGDYAYVCNESGGGLKIIDLSGLPDTVVYQDTMIAGIETAHNLWIEGERLYVCGSPTFSGGIGIFSLADPANPLLLGQYPLRYVHDIYVRDSIGYAAEIDDGLLTIIDLSDPMALSILGQTTYPNALTHNTWLNDASTVCFTTDELSSAYISAWDISDPGNITLLDRIRSSVNEGRGMPHNAHVLNDWLISSYYRDGIHLSDAARPNNLVEVGYFPARGSVWGAYPYLPSGLVLASDIWAGLSVLQANYERAAYLEGNISDLATGQALNDVSIEFETEELETKSLLNGDYAIGSVINGSFDVRFSSYGYTSEVRTVNLQQGVLTIEDVALTPAPELGTVYMYLSDSLTGAGITNGTILVEDRFTDATFIYKEGEDAAPFNGLYEGQYEIYAGAWGHITRKWELTLTAGETDVQLRLLPGYYDDFLFEYDWLLLSSTLPGSWERSVPLVGLINDSIVSPAADIDTDLGDFAFMTQNSAPDGSTVGVRNGWVSLESPLMNLSTYNDPVIHFHYWFCGLGFAFGQGFATTDSMQVILAGQSGSAVLAEYSGYMPYWQQDSFRVADFLPNDSIFQVIFTTANVEVSQTVEALVDQFWVKEGPISSTAIDASFEPLLEIYPNPSQGSLQIRWQDGQPFSDEYQIFDLQGKALRSERSPSGRLHLDLANGIYHLVFQDKGGVRRSQKIVILR